MKIADIKIGQVYAVAERYGTAILVTDIRKVETRSYRGTTSRTKVFGKPCYWNLRYDADGEPLGGYELVVGSEESMMSNRIAYWVAEDVETYELLKRDDFAKQRERERAALAERERIEALVAKVNADQGLHLEIDRYRRSPLRTVILMTVEDLEELERIIDR